MKKKASFMLTAKTFLIVLIAIALLILLISFLSKGVKVFRTFEGKIPVPAPVAVINMSNRTQFIGRNVSFDGSRSYDKYSKIVGYHWDIDGDRSIDISKQSFDIMYLEPGEYNVTLTVLNKEGAIGKESAILKIYPTNLRNYGRYGGGGGTGGSGDTQQPPEEEIITLFLIADKLSTQEDNWRDILRLVPVTMWRDQFGTHQYLYSVYYYTQDFENSDVSFLLSTHGMEVANFYGELPPGIQEGPIPNSYYQVILTEEGEYFDYWQKYDTVVVLDYNNEELGLISALYASFLNSPIIFLNKDNLNEFEGIIKGKEIYLILKNPDDAIDQEVMDFLTNNATLKEPRYSWDLRNPSTNPFYKLASSVLLPVEP